MKTCTCGEVKAAMEKSIAKWERVRCSLRSNGDYDVSAIAKSFGGGGHRNAGVWMPVSRMSCAWLTRRG